YPEAHGYLGMAETLQGHFKEAIAHFQDQIRLNPSDAAAYFNRAIAYGGMDDLAKSLADLDRAVRLKPDYVEAYANRGVAHLFLNDPKRAIEDFDTAIKLNPNDFKPYH